MQFTIQNKHLIKWLWLSKYYGEKCLLKIFFLIEDEVLLG